MTDYEFEPLLSSLGVIDIFNINAQYQGLSVSGHNSELLSDAEESTVHADVASMIRSFLRLPLLKMWGGFQLGR